MHRVTPVHAAKEERVSLVLSFGSTGAFEEDATRTIRLYNDPENITSWEIARHYAWKTSGQLNYIIEESDPDTMNPSDFVNILENAAEKLKKVSNIIK